MKNNKHIIKPISIPKISTKENMEKCNHIWAFMRRILVMSSTDILEFHCQKCLKIKSVEDNSNNQKRLTEDI